jgi:hypothetical protein
LNDFSKTERQEDKTGPVQEWVPAGSGRAKVED